MRVLKKTLKDHMVTLLWFGILIIFLLFKPAPPGAAGSLFKNVFMYWRAHADFLFSALGNTLSIALPAAIFLLLISFFLALAAASWNKIAPWLSVLVIFISLMPSVYLIHMLRIVLPGKTFNSMTFAAFVLIFSNLVLYFFFLGFKKDILEEFGKDYHFLSRQLGITNKFVSARQKLVLIAAQRFLPLFIMVFSSTIFVESKLNVKGGIYTFLYGTVKSIDHRPDIFWGQFLFILIFVIILQLCYGAVLNYINMKYF